MWTRTMIGALAALVLSGTVVAAEPYVGIGATRLSDLDSTGFRLHGGLRFDDDWSLEATVHRFNADGSPDTSYGINGRVSVVIDPGVNLELYDCAIQSDGKLVATGPYGANATSGFPIIRLNTDGSFDNTFSGDGKYLKTLGTSVASAFAYCIAVAPDGKIFVGGNAPTLLESAMTVVSVNKTGGANTAFGNFGTKKIEQKNAD